MKIYIGIDIGGTKIATIIADENFNIKSKERFLTKETITPEKTMDKIVENIGKQLQKLNLDETYIKSIGISCGGPLNSKEGVILSPPNLPGWDNVRIVEKFKEIYKKPVFIQNDANACALAEWKLGAGIGYENLIFLTFGTGMGAGLILNNKLYTGKQDTAGEVGHIRLSNTGPLGFGKKGSFEGFCSGGGIVKLGEIFLNKAIKEGYNGRLVELYRNRIEAKEILDLAQDGEELSLKIINESARRLGQGLSILIDILNPEAIIIGSIYTRCENLFNKRLKREIQKEALDISLRECKILPAKLNENIGDLAALIVATGNY
ncbi:ROK family protein [Cetobacterium sp. 8H]|uniref:ROK family protein n=1 Tax=Cetobacterium sp. 8H TaxID=2759681 RepID=UPI00163CF05C|nr:ROK family protein [Cetobacterium sp. 8H]MBC2850102.1 ROK family protein [Cetobacterium sp. 8H]